MIIHRDYTAVEHAVGYLVAPWNRSLIASGHREHSPPIPFHFSRSKHKSTVNGAGGCSNGQQTARGKSRKYKLRGKRSLNPSASADTSHVSSFLQATNIQVLIPSQLRWKRGRGKGGRERISESVEFFHDRGSRNDRPRLYRNGSSSLLLKPLNWRIRNVLSSINCANIGGRYVTIIASTRCSQHQELLIAICSQRHIEIDPDISNHVATSINIPLY